MYHEPKGLLMHTGCESGPKPGGWANMAMIPETRQDDCLIVAPCGPL